MPFDLQVFATMKGLLTRQPFAVGGSGSSYVYGFVDAEYRRGMNKQECQQFVVNSKIFSFVFFYRASDDLMLRGNQTVDVSYTDSSQHLLYYVMLQLVNIVITCIVKIILCCSFPFLVALSLAMNRDGSSGGVAYIVTIDEHGTEEKVILGNQLPTFFDQ